MATTNFEHDGKDYELCITRAGIRMAQTQGFVTSDLDQKPDLGLAYLFFAGLVSRYKINLNKTSSMLDDLLDDGTFNFVDLFEVLTGAYNDLFGSGESEEKTTKTRTKATEKST